VGQKASNKCRIRPGGWNFLAFGVGGLPAGRFTEGRGTHTRARPPRATERRRSTGAVQRILQVSVRAVPRSVRRTGNPSPVRVRPVRTPVDLSGAARNAECPVGNMLLR